jgi:hypothetical protein
VADAQRGVPVGEDPAVGGHEPATVTGRATRHEMTAVSTELDCGGIIGA